MRIAHTVTHCVLCGVDEFTLTPWRSSHPHTPSFRCWSFIVSTSLWPVHRTVTIFLFASSANVPRAWVVNRGSVCGRREEATTAAANVQSVDRMAMACVFLHLNGAHTQCMSQFGERTDNWTGQKPVVFLGFQFWNSNLLLENIYTRAVDGIQWFEMKCFSLSHSVHSSHTDECRTPSSSPFSRSLILIQSLVTHLCTICINLYVMWVQSLGCSIPLNSLFPCGLSLYNNLALWMSESNRLLLQCTAGYTFLYWFTDTMHSLSQHTFSVHLNWGLLGFFVLFRFFAMHSNSMQIYWIHWRVS